MMQKTDFDEAVRLICQKDSRYDPEAYLFVKEAFDYAVELLEKPKAGSGRDVTAAELLEGVRRYALKEYGPMAFTVLKSWGVSKTADLGEIVYNVVETGHFGKNDADRKEDFANGYDFPEAFQKPFLPSKKRKSTDGAAKGASEKRKSGPRKKKQGEDK